jgi:hypothetical protein
MVAAQARATSNSLYAAAKMGDVLLCAFFVVSSVQPVTSHDLMRSASIAASSHHFYAFIYFIHLGADVSPLGDYSMLLASVAKGDKALFRTTLEGLTARSHSSLADLLLHVEGACRVVFSLACLHEEVEVVRAMLMHPHVGPEHCGLDSHRAIVSRLLSWCGTIGDIDCAIILLEHGANLDWTDDIDGMSAMHHACANNNIGFVAFLLDNGARSAIRDRAGQRPVDVALSVHNEKIVETLEYAMIEEAITSMAGLTVVRIVKDYLGDGEEWQETFELKSGLTVLEGALRELCELSDVFNMNCERFNESALLLVLEKFDNWRLIDDTKVSLLDHIAIGKDTLNSLITAGVTIKGHLQELLSDLTQVNGRHQGELGSEDSISADV